MNNKKITVCAIIPIYNGSEFICHAIESFLKQDDPVEELILVDDGSTDESLRIIEKYESVQNIKIIKKENGGQSSARNLGVLHAKSSHIAFLDQDDVWYPSHNRILKTAFQDSDQERVNGLVYANLDQIEKNWRLVKLSILNDIKTEHPKKSISECLSNDMFILPGASLYLKSAFTDIGGYDERLSGYEDDDLNLRLFT